MMYYQDGLGWGLDWGLVAKVNEQPDLEIPRIYHGCRQNLHFFLEGFYGKEHLHFFFSVAKKTFIFPWVGRGQRITSLLMPKEALAKQGDPSCSYMYSFKNRPGVLFCNLSLVTAGCDASSGRGGTCGLENPKTEEKDLTAGNFCLYKFLKRSFLATVRLFLRNFWRISGAGFAGTDGRANFRIAWAFW